MAKSASPPIRPSPRSAARPLPSRWRGPGWRKPGQSTSCPTKRSCRLSWRSCRRCRSPGSSV